MQLPVDVKAVIDEATNIDEARNTPLSVSVYIDESAPGDVIAHVRSAFASASASARVSMTYLGGSSFMPRHDDDMAVVVAGLCQEVGAYVEQLQAVGVPTMVATTLPSLVAEIADAQGHPLASADIVSPEVPKCALRLLPGKAADGGTSFAEPSILDKSMTPLFDHRMGEWVIEACHAKRLAFALAFPFVRRPLSADAVNATAAQNAGIGLVMFIPGADLPIMTLNQAKMLLQIAAAYGEPMSVDRVKELAAVVSGAFAFRALARQVVALVPALGWVVKAAIGYSGTQAMGRAAIEYFEGGGNIAGLGNVVVGARDKAVELAGEAQNLVTGNDGIAGAHVKKGGRFTRAARTTVAKVKNAAVPFANSVVQAGVQAAGTDAGAVAKIAARSVARAAHGRFKGSRPTSY